MADYAENQIDTLVLPLLPLTTGVVLPQMVVTLALETDDSKHVAKAATDGERLLLLVPRIDGRYARVGTVARVENDGELPNGMGALVLRGLYRAVVGVGVPGTGDVLWVEAEPVEDGEPTERARELAREYRAIVAAIADRLHSRRLVEVLAGVTDPGALADTVGWWPELAFERKVEALETVDVEERLEKVVQWARDALGELELAEKIRSDVSEGMEKTQREYLLRQQLAAIKKELGDSGDDGDVVEEYRRKIAESKMPGAAREAVTREVDRLERMSEQSPEHGWVRTWLDTVVELPWGTFSDENLDVRDARAVLDADHTGLDDVKERIVEYLAVRKLRADRGLTDEGGRGNGLILSLVGPPGVGKTSLGESVARAMGRKFVRVSLGGVRDEAEIRGHRRTYVGALPGRLVRAIREAGSMNPVILLDEIDKVGSDYRGDPSAALLEVLDPAQNHTFRDHYLEVELDLSDVLFIATANVAEAIPEPLLDRMDLIRLDGYTEDEKLTIARDHLLPRQLTRAGLDQGDVTFTDDAYRKLATEYTREAGVRSLERSIARTLRKIAAKLAVPAGQSGTAGGLTLPLTVDDAGLKEYLGHARHTPESAERTGVPGVAAGLAVTGAGGDLLFIEASLADKASGGTGVTLTGQLGDVMKESAQIALSYLRSNGPKLGLPVAELAERGVHLHVPAGAVPKDGPSAGITMTTALASLLSGRLVKSDVAMTGEVSLTGRVLPIGGLKQKLLAAHRAGITTVLIPARNAPDLDEVPEKVREALDIHLVADVREVLDTALEPEPAQHATPTLLAA
ncbi:MAG TPA: endopeptidase La [Streptosporangiaceae bacterium]|nr:endopeptidase La [Streptosporangiaceae bacterium]